MEYQVHSRNNQDHTFRNILPDRTRNNHREEEVPEDREVEEDQSKKLKDQNCFLHPWQIYFKKFLTFWSSRKNRLPNR